MAKASSSIYGTARNLAKMASQIRDIEDFAEAMKTGNYAGFMEKKLNRTMKAEMHKAVTRVGRQNKAK